MTNNQITKTQLYHAIGASLLYFCMSLAPRFLFFPGIIVAYFAIAPFMALGFIHGWKVASITCLITVSILEVSTSSNYGFFHLLYVYIPVATLTWAYETSKRYQFFNGYYGIISATLISMMLAYSIGLLAVNIAEIDLKKLIIQTPKMLSQHIEIDGFIELLLSFFLTSWVVQVLANAFIARMLLVKKNIISNMLINAWNIPKFWDIPLTVGLLIMLTSEWFSLPHMNAWGRSIAINSALMLGLIGCRILYTLIMHRTHKKGLFWLYIFMCFMLAWPFIIVVVLGFVEPWYDLTKIHKAKKQ